MPKLAITQHEYSLDNGSTWAVCTAPMDNGDGTATITGITGAVTTGHLIVRRIGETNPAKYLRNASDFTATASGPVTPAAPGLVIDDTANTATVTMVSGYANKADYEYMFNPTVTPPALATPANFAAVSAGQTTINITWGDVANEISYLIEYSTNGGTSWNLLTTAAANATSYARTGLTLGTTEHYRMKAIGNGSAYSDSAFTSVVSATTSGASAINYDDKDAPVIVSNGRWEAGGGGFGANRAVATSGLTGDFEIHFDMESAVSAFQSYILWGLTDAPNKATYNTGMKAVFYIADDDANIRFFSNGGQSNSGVAKATGQRLKIQRVGSTITSWVSTNGGTSYTQLNTFSYTSSATLYACMDLGGTEGIVLNPSFQSL